ncbi:MAG: hypothetical protein LBJ82_06840 [Deltaproteobacteria bacterium]|jgi:hypothetical protein|nr:hypothetical protein [Deltaproteobacteria bacterium]
MSQELRSPPGFDQGSLMAQMEEAQARKLTIGSLVADREMGRALGWSPNLVGDNREEAGLLAKRQIISQNELFASWAKQDKENAAIALEDLNKMLSAFEALQQEKQRQGMLTAGEKAGVSLDRGLAQVHEAFLGFGQLIMENFGREGFFNLASLAPENFEDLSWIDTSKGRRERERARADYSSSVLRVKDQATAASLAARRKGIRENMPAPLLDGGFLYDLIESAPQMLTQIGAGMIGGMIGGPGGAAAAGMGMMGPQIAGGQYGALRDEGISPGRAAKAGLANAAMQMPLEAISLNRFFSIFKAKGLKAVGIATGKSMATEYLTEFVQHYPEVATELYARIQERGEGDLARQFLDRLPQTHREGHHEGLIGAMWGIFGGAGRLAYERAHALRATAFRERMGDIFTRLTNTGIKQQSPDITQGMLEFSGADRNVFVDSGEALRLYQSGGLDLDVLEVTEKELVEAAAMGQDIPVRLARMLAYSKGAPEFEAIINMTRDVPYSETVAEINREGRRQESVDRVIDALKAQQAQEDAFAGEIARIEAEFAGAARETDTLQKETVTESGGEKPYAKSVAEFYAAFARRWISSPEAQLEFLRKVRALGPDSAAREASFRAAEAAGRFAGEGNFEDYEFSLPPDAGPLPDLEDLGDLFTPEEYARLQDEQALMAAMGITADMSELQRLRATQPWLGAVWGRLDGKSLRTTWPDAFKEIQRNYGLGIFRSKEKGGLPADRLADELVRENIFQQGMGADELVEKLKEPKGGWRGTLFQAAPPVGSEAFRAWFGDSKVVDGNGEPLNLWHQTGAAIETFDPRRPGAGEFDNQLPSGIFMKPDDRDIGLPGKAQIPLYARIENPFYVADRAALRNYLETNVEGYAELQKRLEEIDTEYQQKLDALENEAYRRFEEEWEPKNPDASPKERGAAMDALFDEVGLNALADQWRGAENGTSAQMKELVDRHFRESGHDGIILEKDEGGIGKKTTKTYIAFDPVQVKSVNNRGTWNPNDPRILYQHGRDPQYAEQQAKFDQLQPVEVSSAEVKELRGGKDFTQRLIAWVESKGLFGTYDNADSRFTGVAFNQASVRSVKRHYAGDGKLAVLQAVPELIRNGVYLETTQRNENGLQSHIFAGRANLDGTEYVVGFVVREDRNGRRYFDHSLTEVSKMTTGLEAEATKPSRPSRENPVRGTAYEDISSIVRKHLGVNPDLTLNSGNLGSVTFTQDQYLIALAGSANLSTLVHETGHIFEAEMRRIAASGLADEWQLADLATLDKWLARFDDDAELKKEYGAQKMKRHYGGRSFDKLSARQKEEARNRAKREYFARGFELYALEGQAPSEGLRGLFERFKNWLLKIYTEAKTLGVEMTDEVRGVFDRMLATEREMDETAAVNELVAMQAAELDKLGVSVADRRYLAGLFDLAKQKAVAEVERQRNRERQARARQWAAEAREELLKDPVYAAMAELRQPGKHLNAGLLVSLLGEDAAAALRKKGVGIVRQEGGQDPEIFAHKHGFSDAAHLLAEITAAESLGRRINEIVAAREALHDAQVDPAPSLLRTEEVGQAMAMTGKYLASANGREPIADSAIREVARKKLAAMPMRKARAHLPFQAAMRRARQRERSASIRGKFAAALEANTQARLNLEFARQALDIAERAEKLIKEARRFSGMNKADPVARLAVNRLASRYGLIPFDERLAGDRSFEDIAGWYAQRKEEGYMMELAPAMFLGENAPWADLPLADFEDVSREIASIIVVERNMRRLLLAGEKAEFAETIETLNETILSFHKLKPEFAQAIEKPGILGHALRKTVAYHTKMENLCRILDGGKPLGPLWTALYKPVNDAENKRGLYFKALKERLRGKEMFGAYSEQELIEMGRRKEHVPSLGESITRGQRIMFALNLGNAGNRLRLERGFGYTEEQIADIIKPLTERDWKFIQAVWDTFEQYKPEAFAMHERVKGTRPTEVEAMPFTVLSADGKGMSLRGGYFPVMYDRKQADPHLADLLDRDRPPAFAAATRKGHLEERTSTGAGTPLALDMTGIARALDDVITDICFREALIDSGRIMRNRSFRETVQGTLGQEYYESMVDWLKDAARSNFAPAPGQNIAAWARNASTLMGMGLKATTVIVQPLGLTQSAEQIGLAAVAEGVNLAYGKGPQATQETIAEIRKLSPPMDTRMQSYDRDVYDATSAFAGQQLTPAGLLDEVTPAGIRAMEKWIKGKAFIPMAGVQFYAVDVPTWLGAFNKYLKENEGKADLQARAVEYADHIVRITQGTGLNKDLSKIQRGSEYLKLFTMFYSYFNTLFGLIQLRSADVKLHQDKAAAMRAANSFLLLVAVPALLSEWLAGRGPDEDEEYWQWAARQLVKYPAQTLIGLRDVSQFVDPKYGYKASPAEDAPASIYNLLAEVTRIAGDPDRFEGKKLGKLALRAYGYGKGLPLKQAEISVFNVIDYLDGTSPDYELRDLVFTRQPGRR